MTQNNRGGMRRPRDEWKIHALSVLVATLPFAFALIRAGRTGHDLRYLWVALASALGTAIVLAASKAAAAGRRAVVAVSAGAFVVAMAFAVLAAVMLGTRVGPGIMVVAASFGLCFAASCALHLFARFQRSDN